MRGYVIHPSRRAAAVRELCATYLEDLGGLDEYGLALALFETQCVPAGTRAELDAVAALAGLPHAEVALANLYYDAMKVAFSGLLGCTAVAVETPPDRSTRATSTGTPRTTSSGGSPS